jgi:hypothetical protein
VVANWLMTLRFITKNVVRLAKQQAVCFVGQMREYNSCIISLLLQTGGYVFQFVYVFVCVSLWIKNYEFSVGEGRY